MNIFGNNLGRWRHGRAPRLALAPGAWLAAALLLLALSPSHASAFSAATLSSPQAVLWVSSCASNSSTEREVVAWLLQSIQVDKSSSVSATISLSQIESLSQSQTHKIEFAPHLRPHLSTHVTHLPAQHADYTPLSRAPRHDDSRLFARQALFAHEAAMRSGTRPHTFLE
jgi:hypothetical protein